VRIGRCLDSGILDVCGRLRSPADAAAEIAR
jgi:hypothetical protein